MKILVVSQYYKPDITAGAFRVAETSEWLAALGHDVRVVTAKPHRALAVDGEAGVVENRPGRPTRVIRVPVWPYAGGSISSYMTHYLSFVIFGCFGALHIAASGWRPDVVWVSSPPLFVGVVGVLFSWIVRCRIVLDVRDIWPESAIGVGQLKRDGAAHRLGCRLELWLYRRVHGIMAVSQSIARYLRQHGDAPVEVVYNASETFIGFPDRYEDERSRRERIIRYVGNLGFMQRLETVVRAFTRVLEADSEQRDWILEFIGAGARKSFLEDLVRDLGMPRHIRFIGVVTKTKAAELMSEADILVLNVRDSEVFENTIPLKVFDYMAAGRPIVAALRGEGRTLLSYSGGNIVCDPDDEAHLAQGLLDAMRNVDTLSRLARRNRELVVKEYNRRAQSLRLEAFLRAVVTNSAHGVGDLATPARGLCDEADE